MINMICVIAAIAAILLILLLIALVMLSITINEASASTEEFNKKLIELGYSNSCVGYCGEMGPTNYFEI